MPWIRNTSYYVPLYVSVSAVEKKLNDVNKTNNKKDEIRRDIVELDV